MNIKSKHINMMKILENIAVVITIFISFLIFLVPFFHIPKLDHLLYHYFEANLAVERILAVSLLFIVWNLYKRRRMAWLITIILLSVDLSSHFILRHHTVNKIIFICEIFVLFVLLLGQRDFKRPTDKLSLRKGVTLAGITFIMVLLNASISFFNIRRHQGQPVNFYQCIVNTIKMLFGINISSASPLINGVIFERFIFFLSWLGIIGCMVLILKPFIDKRTTTKSDKEHARILVQKYGQNPGSYLTLEDDKTYYFGRDVDGVIAYGIVGDIIVANGDPICAPEDFPCLLSEFKEYCAVNSYESIFLSVTDTYLDIYKMLGFGHIKCGEEARFHLKEYALAGGKMAKLRADVNHANKANITTKEYKPNEKKEINIEKAIAEVSNKWLSTKKMGQLGFTVGGVGLEDPLDKRYFYAENEEGTIVAFTVFVPFAGMNGYMADVTRRTPDSPSGVMEKIIYDAFMVFKEEGIEWGSLGLAPLSNVREDGVKDSASTKLLSFIYENLNNFYGFKDLRRTKEKYSPSTWEPGYFTYSSKIITPQMAFAIVKIQNPQGIMDYIRGFFHSKKAELKNEKNKE